MEPPYFSVQLDILERIVNFSEVQPSLEIKISHGSVIRAVRLTHPGGALGYRFDCPQGSLCFITDHEHPAEGLSEPVVEFVRVTTLLIHNAQYTPE
jgi:phosphoribosyl 1,2-cyclic phosphodiesterase